MILDSSAVVAIFLQEPGYDALLDKMAAAPVVGIGGPSLVEAAIVLSSRLGRDARGLLARFILESSVTVLAFSDVHWGSAVDAWLRFGKGRHAAALNFGDCLSYALARVEGQPLLCVGDDFARTDLSLA